jgi:hypothetical protein
MLVADGTGHTGATGGLEVPLRAAGGCIVSGPFCLYSSTAIAKDIGGCIFEAQFRQHALELLLQEILSNANEQLRITWKRHAAGKQTPIRCSFAFLDELLLDVSHPKL